MARKTPANSEPLKQTGRSLSTVLWTKVKAISPSTIHFREFIPLTGFDPLYHSFPLFHSCFLWIGACVCAPRSRVHLKSLKTSSHRVQQPPASAWHHMIFESWDNPRTEPVMKVQNRREQFDLHPKFKSVHEHTCMCLFLYMCLWSSAAESPRGKPIPQAVYLHQSCLLDPWWFRCITK